MARQRIEGLSLNEEELLDLEHGSAVEALKAQLARLTDFNVRLELFFRAEWFWGMLGPSVQFTIVGRHFLLVKGDGIASCISSGCGGRTAHNPVR
jgi:hypothetical protein